MLMGRVISRSVAVLSQKEQVARAYMPPAALRKVPHELSSLDIRPLTACAL